MQIRQIDGQRFSFKEIIKKGYFWIHFKEYYSKLNYENLNNAEFLFYSEIKDSKDLKKYSDCLNIIKIKLSIEENNFK